MVNLKIGGLVTSMQRSFLGDVSPPSSMDSPSSISHAIDDMLVDTSTPGFDDSFLKVVCAEDDLCGEDPLGQTFHVNIDESGGNDQVLINETFEPSTPLLEEEEEESEVKLSFSKFHAANQCCKLLKF